MPSAPRGCARELVDAGPTGSMARGRSRRTTKPGSSIRSESAAERARNPGPALERERSEPQPQPAGNNQGGRLVSSKINAIRPPAIDTFFQPVTSCGKLIVPLCTMKRKW
jgi:hypothetical protein